MEWVVEAHGCDPDRLRDRESLQQVFNEIVRDLDLHPVGETAWHEFPVTRGLTGLLMLRESHLACHTFPEHASICINLFCCKPRKDWAWQARLGALLNAGDVKIRRLEREYVP